MDQCFDLLLKTFAAPCALLLDVFSQQRGHIESFNGRLRDECLNEQWLPSLLHARAEIERWRREYNEDRPKKALGVLTPAAHAKQLQ